RHLPRQVVGDGAVGNGLAKGGDNAIGDLVPAQMLEHHDAGEDDGSGIDLVQARVLGRCAVGGFENGGAVSDIGARGQAQPAHLGGAGVGQVVAVKVKGRDYGIFIR